MYYISSLSDEWSSSVVQAAHSLTAASAEAQLIVTPPTTINKIYKFIQTHTCHCLSHRYALSQFSDTRFYAQNSFKPLICCTNTRLTVFKFVTTLTQDSFQRI